MSVNKVSLLCGCESPEHDRLYSPPKKRRCGERLITLLKATPAQPTGGGGTGPWLACRAAWKPQARAGRAQAAERGSCSPCARPARGHVGSPPHRSAHPRALPGGRGGRRWGAVTETSQKPSASATRASQSTRATGTAWALGPQAGDAR